MVSVSVSLSDEDRGCWARKHSENRKGLEYFFYHVNFVEIATRELSLLTFYFIWFDGISYDGEYSKFTSFIAHS